MINRFILASCALLLFANAPAQAQGSSDLSGFTSAQYQAQLDGAWRSPENRARDKYRHPTATLQFFGLNPGQTVIEITPGNGWYSEIIGPLLHDSGHYIAAVYAEGGGENASKAKASLANKFSLDPAHYGKSSIVEFNGNAPVFGSAGSADLVLTFRNVHNWSVAGNAPAMFKAFYAVLKPGGVLGVVDHRASAGVDDSKNGYVPVAEVIKLATDAGFTLDAQSEINANPKDTKNYPEGVWTLPPTLKLGERDKAKYLAIGESDRMTLRFIKAK
ncbi:class I SAM-dependent methyltransferase [Dyella tabacisoli]|uniref:Methyltransferase n=1 Tax=Dyella tabacisoli TaxID=2282381 RepID=A0A369UU01_9GAMM|nr:class I SAM-dependent methyltransferase [Dyella tabacisoli]RDD83080.1 methyltransferase [Dyella tabacisoli]